MTRKEDILVDTFTRVRLKTVQVHLLKELQATGDKSLGGGNLKKSSHLDFIIIILF